LLLAVLLQPVGGWLLAAIGAEPPAILHWLAAFSGTSLLLLPATMAMGASLPAIERALASTERRHTSVALLYAVNTCGALLGVLATAFVLVPTFGLTATALVCAALNLTCAGAALQLFSAAAPRSGSDTPPMTAARNVVSTPGLRRVLLLTGLLGIGYEVLAVRVLSQVAENTVYTLALMLAAYRVGTTAGAAAYPALRRRCADPGELQDSLLLALAATCLIGTLSMSGAAAAKSWLSSLLPTSVAMALTAEAALAAAAFLVPTFFMGALFTHLATRARDVAFGFSRAFRFNTLGAALAPMLFGVLVVPQIGTKVLLIPSRTSRRDRGAGGAASIAVVGYPLRLAAVAKLSTPAGRRLVSYAEGVLATVSVVEDSRGVARLHINNRQQEGSSATFYIDGRQGLMPLLLHANPQHVLFLGLGTGATAAAAAAERRLTIDVVELLPEVVAASAYFNERMTATATRERLRILTADARRYVRATERRYDVIVSDNFHPARSGSAALYTVEHFSAVRDRLAPGGLFCQWLPLHQLDLPTLRSIVRSFLAAFPQGTALLASYSLDTPVIGLVAAAGDGRIRVDAVRARLATVQRQGRSLEDYGFDSELALLGSFVAGPDALARFAGDAPLNTDDRSIVAYRAPRATYAPGGSAPRPIARAIAEVDVTPEQSCRTS
jgi:spermidine synthase